MQTKSGIVNKTWKPMQGSRGKGYVNRKTLFTRLFTRFVYK